MSLYAVSGSSALKPVHELRYPNPRPKRHLHALPSLKSPPAKHPPTAEDIPPPDLRMIQKLAVYGYEVLDGSRSVTQLGAWISRGVAAQLTSRRAAWTERRSLYRDYRRLVPIPGRVHFSQVSSRVAEATVVVRTEMRSTAVAIRLEFSHRRWRATDLTVL